jgi:hypothetical protein
MPGTPVKPTRCFRVKASLLLAVFLVAGTSFPSLDAVLYHSQGPDAQRWQTHVEVAGDCLDHSEHCALGRTAPGSSAVAEPDGPIHTQLIGRPTSLRLPAQPHIEADRRIAPQPRAPPAPLI